MPYHAGTLTSHTFVKNADGTYTCTETYQCTLSAAGMQEDLSSLQASRVAQAKYDQAAALASLDSDIAKLQAALA